MPLPAAGANGSICCTAAIKSNRHIVFHVYYLYEIIVVAQNKDTSKVNPGLGLRWLVHRKDWIGLKLSIDNRRRTY